MDNNGNSEAQTGYGSGFFLTVGGTKIEIDEVTKIAFAEETAGDFEKTHFKSPRRRKEFGASLIDPGEDTIEINYIPGSPTDVAIRTARDSGEVCAYESYIPAPDGKWMKTAGFLIVKSRGKAVPIEDRMTQTINCRFTGDAVESIATAQPDLA